MYNKIKQNYDVVCASRYVDGGGQIAQNSKSLIKKALSMFVGLSLHYLKGIPTHDITNSFRMYKREIFKYINIESDTGFLSFVLFVHHHLHIVMHIQHHNSVLFYYT